MRTVIAGSRDITDTDRVCLLLDECPWTVTTVLSGKAPGVDTIGEHWADTKGVPVDPYPPDTKRYGVPVAFFIRNQVMAENAEALMLVWDGNSKGSRDMLERAKRQCLRIYEVILQGSVVRKIQHPRAAKPKSLWGFE